MIEQAYLDDVLLQMRKLKELADGALRQTRDEHLFALIDPEANSIAILIRHIAGNMRSRWTDFLTTDGEKPDRNRDSEFVVAAGETRAQLMSIWEDGWGLVFRTVSALTAADVTKAVRIRGETHTVLEALNRQLAHYAQHVGQIVLLAKHYAGPEWQSLSIPKGRSADFDVSKRGAPYSTEGPRAGDTH